jgi:DNA polymerase III epsilon subunit-like protein
MLEMISSGKHGPRTGAGEPYPARRLHLVREGAGDDNQREPTRSEHDPPSGDAEGGRAKAIRWARQMLEPGAAVVLDTETTDLDGVVIEIAVIDAATGATLLNTLADPAGEQTSPEAYATHGIGTASLAGAPPWAEVLTRLLEVTAGRQILAYKADFDMAAVVRTSTRHHLSPGHLADPARWECIMKRRSEWARSSWLPLGGSHRALGDCRDARQVVQAITAS